MDYIKVVKDNLPELDDKRINYEGSKIVIYTRNKKFFLTQEEKVKDIVDKIKKRIEVRIEPDELLSTKETIETIKKIIPKEAKIYNIYFEPDFSKVTIDVRYPQIAVGEKGEIVKKIKKETYWIPLVRRVATPKSPHVEAIRKALYQSSKYRKRFLNSIGKEIYLAEPKDTKYARITFLGSGREVGRSCMILQTLNSNIMLDCGISTGATNDDQFPIFTSDFNINSIDAIVLSHAHLDHCGFIPYLFKMGYKGPVYCAEPTRELSALLQIDAIQLMQKETGKSLYTSSDIKKMIKNTIPLKYKEVTDITSDIRLIFENAGHLLGSAISHFNIANGKTNIIYTGDMRYSASNLLDPAFTQFLRSEALIMEGTYGASDNISPRLEDSEKEIISTIKKTIKRKGKILVPSFAVGRAQELMLILEKYDIDIPIYVDGMIYDVNSIHSTYPKYLAYNLQRQIIEENNNPFESDRFTNIASGREREQVLSEEKPYLVIATSGMLNGGPILEYLKKYGSDKKSTLIFVGYQAQGTLGNKIQRGDKEIELQNGEKVNINLEIKTIEGLSGHSDRKQLLNFIGHLKNKPRRVIINHGEASKTLNLSGAIQKVFNIEAYAPMNLEAIRFI
jgi:hypothetical protein